MPRSADVLPQTGRIERLRLPEGIRVDAGVAEGDEIGIAYDPLIAKLIAHGATRDEAFDVFATHCRKRRSKASRPISRFCAGSSGTRSSVPGNDDRVPYRASTTLRRTGAGGRCTLADAVPAEPRVAGTALPPDIDASAADHRGAAAGRAASPPDARNGDQALVGAATRCGPAATRRAGGDEDGDAAHVSV